MITISRFWRSRNESHKYCRQSGGSLCQISGRRTRIDESTKQEHLTPETWSPNELHRMTAVCLPVHEAGRNIGYTEHDTNPTEPVFSGSANGKQTQEAS
jgi:hypothetical protein